MAFSLLFFCLQVAADQFCFKLPLPSPFSLFMFCSSSLVMRKRKSPSRRRNRGWLYALSLALSRSQVYLPAVHVCMCAHEFEWIEKKKVVRLRYSRTYTFDDGSTWQTSLLNFFFFVIVFFRMLCSLECIICIYIRRKQIEFDLNFMFIQCVFFYSIRRKKKKRGDFFVLQMDTYIAAASHWRIKESRTKCCDNKKFIWNGNGISIRLINFKLGDAWGACGYYEIKKKDNTIFSFFLFWRYTLEFLLKMRLYSKWFMILFW